MLAGETRVVRRSLLIQPPELGHRLDRPSHLTPEQATVIDLWPLSLLGHTGWRSSYRYWNPHAKPCSIVLRSMLRRSCSRGWSLGNRQHPADSRGRWLQSIKSMRSSQPWGAASLLIP